MENDIKGLEEVAEAVKGDGFFKIPELPNLEEYEAEIAEAEHAAQWANELLSTFRPQIRKLLGLVRKLAGTAKGQEYERVLNRTLHEYGDPEGKTRKRAPEVCDHVLWQYAYELIADALLNDADPDFFSVFKQLTEGDERTLGLRLLQEVKMHETVGGVPYFQKGGERNARYYLPIVDTDKAPPDLRQTITTVLNESLPELARISYEHQKAVDRDRRDEFEQGAIKSSKEFFEGKPGIYVEGIPPESFTYKEQERKHPGGHLKLESDGIDVTIKDVGPASPKSFTRYLEVIQKWEDGKVISETDGPVRRETMIPLSSVVDQEYFHLPGRPPYNGMREEERECARRLWNVLRRRFKQYQEKMARKAEAEKAEVEVRKASDYVEPDVWLIDGKDGRTLIKLPEFDEIHHIWFVPKRSKGTIKLIEAASHAAQLFPDACYQENEEGERYGKMPEGFRKVLRGSATRAVRIQEREAGQEGIREWVENGKSTEAVESAVQAAESSETGKDSETSSEGEKDKKAPAKSRAKKAAPGDKAEA